MKIVTSEQMQQIEQECAKIGLPPGVLMENAGRAIAGEIRRILGETDRRQALLLIGPGNNGGDGLVAARHLHDWGFRVSLYLCRQRANDPNLESVRKRGITCVEASQDEKLDEFGKLLSSAGCVVDGLFGTGKIRPLQGIFQKVLQKVAQARSSNAGLRIIAVDLPSGLNADSGAADPACLYADNTITLGFPKPGLYNFPGAERTGKITIADIGIPGYLADAVTTELLTEEWARTVLPRRPLNAHKGSFGRVLVFAGSINYIGAAYLACSGALRAGAGLVTLATAASLQPILAAKLNETTYLPLPESSPGTVSPQAAGVIKSQLGSYDVLLAGCGLGQSQSITQLVTSMLSWKELPPLVFDADMLNILAKIPKWWQQLGNDAILTPHPGEMARLSGLPVAEIQSDRLGTARRLALEWHKTITLKGAFTVITTPEGCSRISPVANPGLASAGTGDVLTGAIAGLLAQGLSLFDAAALGVYLHGKAGDMVKDAIGDTGMIATDLLPALPAVIKQLKEKNQPPIKRNG